MKESFIEGLEKTQDGLKGRMSKGSVKMILGGLVTIVGINTMLNGLETVVEASTVNDMLNVFKELAEED